MAPALNVITELGAWAGQVARSYAQMTVGVAEIDSRSDGKDELVAAGLPSGLISGASACSGLTPCDVDVRKPAPPKASTMKTVKITRGAAPNSELCRADSGTGTRRVESTLADSSDFMPSFDASEGSGSA